jgi:plasmid stabilization system protein ParE
MSRYRLARQAKADLDEIWSYVARHSGPQLADRLPNFACGSILDAEPHA